MLGKNRGQKRRTAQATTTTTTTTVTTQAQQRKPSSASSRGDKGGTVVALSDVAGGGQQQRERTEAERQESTDRHVRIPVKVGSEVSFAEFGAETGVDMLDAVRTRESRLWCGLRMLSS